MVIRSGWDAEEPGGPAGPVRGRGAGPRPGPGPRQQVRHVQGGQGEADTAEELRCIILIVSCILGG